MSEKSETFLSQRFFNVPVSAVVLSLCLHLSLVGLWVITTGLEKMGFKVFQRKDVFKEAYQSFIQVDVVALPDELPGEKSQMDTSLPVVDNPATTPDPVKEAEESKSQMTLHDDKMEEVAKKAAAEKKKIEESKRLADEKKEKQAKLDAALKKIQEEAKREQALKALQAKAGQKGRKKMAGNLLSKGTSVTGIVGTAKDQFTARIVEAIKQNFNVYFWQQRKGLAAAIHLEFYPTGKVRKREIVKKSIDPTYDSAILQAIDATSFPVPEDPSILSDDYNITFVP